jgi:hypothetical protein
MDALPKKHMTRFAVSLLGTGLFLIGATATGWGPCGPGTILGMLCFVALPIAIVTAIVFAVLFVIGRFKRRANDEIQHT